MPLETLTTKINALTDQKQKLQTEIDNIGKMKTRRKDALKYINAFDDIIEHGTFKEIRTVIKALIEKIVITDDDIEIYWNF